MIYIVFVYHITFENFSDQLNPSKVNVHDILKVMFNVKPYNNVKTPQI